MKTITRKQKTSNQAKAPKARPASVLQALPQTKQTRPAPGTDLAAAEAKTIAKYPNLKIVKGSLRPGEDKLEGKRVVDVRCECGLDVTRATSDLWSFKGCPTCFKLAKKKSAKKTETKTEKPTPPTPASNGHAADFPAWLATLPTKSQARLKRLLPAATSKPKRVGIKGVGQVVVVLDKDVPTLRLPNKQVLIGRDGEWTIEGPPS